MRFESFKIDNFRGIKSTTLTLNKHKNSRINALVGLNESGKTTILEGIHHFLSNPNLLKKLPSSAKRSAEEYQKMIPINERALFNGNIQIKALVSIEDEDWVKIENYLLSEFPTFKSFEKITSIYITHRLEFFDSKIQKTTNMWDVYFHGKKTKGKSLTRLENDDWLKAANFVEQMLPKIVYFPSELLEFPDRIVLENAPKKDKEEHSSFWDEPRNDFYCSVLDDVLRAINPTLSLEKHLLARAKSKLPSDKENLADLLLKIGRNLKQTVFSEWKKIFEHAPNYDFQVNLTTKNEQFGLEIKIITDDGIFSINERSAGFRWFFAFIMITRYRLHRQDRVLFLFDEPAANLHPNAQTQLLKSFELLSEDADIIYTTHSHYLINPLWLDSTHIVRNTAAEKDSYLIDNNPKYSAINVTSYRSFVGNHPDQYFYYRPIQEALDYSPSPLEFPEYCILVEGKTDFFAIKYFSSLFEGYADDYWPNIFPGGGAGSLDPLVSLLYGWGKKFLILVDSDEAGNIQKKRYAAKFEKIVENLVYSIDDIKPEWKGFKIEQLITKEDLNLIRDNSFPEKKNLTKKQLHMAIQEQIRNPNKLPISNATIDNFSFLLTALKEKIIK